jgi:RNA polymerase sigma-70 factor (ECF subfamily)
LNLEPGHNNEKTLEVLFSEIFRQHEFRLYTLALRLTKSDQVAKDIIQEVFLKLWEQRNNIHTIHNMEAWLYRLTENKVIDFLRKVSADSRLKKMIWDQLQQIVNEAEQYVSAKEYNQIIQKAINELPPQRRLIYQLNKGEGMNYQQIAKELQLSKHTVKNQLFTAVQSIRRFIAKSTKLFSIFSWYAIGIMIA